MSATMSSACLSSAGHRARRVGTEKVPMDSKTGMAGGRPGPAGVGGRERRAAPDLLPHAGSSAYVSSAVDHGDL